MHRHLRNAFLPGRAREQPPLQALHSLLSTMVSVPAGGFARRYLAACFAPAIAFGRRCVPTSYSHACLAVPISSDRDRVESLRASLLRPPLPFGTPSAATADLDTLGAADELHFGDPTARYVYAGWEREQRAESTCYATVRYILLGQPLALPTEILTRFPTAPPFRRLRSLLARVDSIPPTMVSSSSAINETSLPLCAHNDQRDAWFVS